MRKDLTVLIPTSPIPSHPSTAILDETIANIRKYTDARIIIMCDGVHESLRHREEDYKQYRMKVLEKELAGDYGDCFTYIFSDHKHQAMMTKFLLDNFVKTPLIMFCEHDTSPIGEIPFNDICELVATKDGIIDCLRFNIFHKIPDEHQYLMLDKEPIMYHQRIKGGVTECLINCVRTIQWSQRPHIAKTDWYRKILATWFPEGKRTMIEDVMHSVVQVQYEQHGIDTFGLAIYTPEGNQLRSYHADGRGEDEKIIEA